MSPDPLKRIRRMAAVSATALVVVVAGYLVLYLDSRTMEFSDPAMEEAVSRAIEGEIGEVHRSDLEELTHLDASGAGITDLSDIALMPNLRSLDLSRNDPHSLAPLTRLRHLEELRIGGMDMRSASERELAELRHLRNLRRLHLDNNPELHDIEALTEFDSLRSLSLRNTDVSELAPIVRLARLRELDLRETSLSRASLTPLTRLGALERLNLRGAGVRDIAPLGDLTGLRYLNLHSNPGIESLEPLRELTRLETLILRNVPIEEDLEVIADMRNLRRLNIRNTGVRELDVLADLMAAGALQDDPDGGIRAEVDIRDNPIAGSSAEGPSGYDPLRPYWEHISARYPERLPRAPTGEVVINEVMTSNGTTLSDRRDEYPDWVELYNPGDAPVDLSGYFLSSDPDEPEMFRFPEGTRLEAGEYLIVFASGAEDSATPSASDLAEDAAELHAGFALSSDGDTVVLTESDGSTTVSEAQVPQIPRDMSYGRRGDGVEGGDWAVYVDPTPGQSNADAPTHQPVSFSEGAGFFETPFDLELSVDDEGVEIYYTLDGSPPDPEAAGGIRTYRYRDHETGRFHIGITRTFRYRGPISIPSSGRLQEEPRTPTLLADIPTTVPEAEFWDWQPPADPGFRATVVRAVAYDGGEYRSRVHSGSYFVHPDAERAFPLGVVSISADPRDFFSYERGIYVPGLIYDSESEARVESAASAAEPHGPNASRSTSPTGEGTRDTGTGAGPGAWMSLPANYGERYEAPSHIEFFEPDGYRALSQDAGVRVHGSWSRAHPLKSLRLYARKDYDRQGYFDYPLFPGATRQGSHEAVTAYKRLLLRSGQSLFRSHLQDGIIHDHVRPHVDVDLLDYRPVVHFINGEYWGLKNLRERFDRFYLESNYGLDPEEVVILERGLGLEFLVDEGRPGDAEPFNRLRAYVAEHDISEEEHYHYVRSRMDVDSFIDYNIVRIFSGDFDGVNKHVAVWRRRGEADPDARPGHDGRWRWHTWDLDNALMFTEDDAMNYYANDRTLAEHRQAMWDDFAEVGVDAGRLAPGERWPRLALPATRDHRYTILIDGLMDNESFRHRFINRFADLLNSVYRPEVHAEAIEEAASRIEPEMRRHIARWGYPASLGYWRSQVEDHLEFVRKRPTFQREHMLDYFRDRGHDTGRVAPLAIELPERGGTVRVNTLLLDEETPGAEPGTLWRGFYFTGVPIEVEAIPDAGFTFERWEGEVPQRQQRRQRQQTDAGSRLELDFDRGRLLRPVFARE